MRLEWQQNTQRRYESGLDQGVLYPSEGPGVPWNGLISVEESSIGGEVEAYHFDGVKYLEKRAPKHFQATITAFSTPKEFAPCVGELSVVPGFVLTRQARQRFGFSYRTLINGGDDYKIHVVYNATATPESRGYTTIAANVSATNFSWKVDAVPPLSDTYRPSAHFTLDTTKTDLFTLRAVEDILYGTVTSEPRLPSVEELVDIVGLWEPKLIVPAAEPQTTVENLVRNPSFEVNREAWGGGQGAYSEPLEGHFGEKCLRITSDGSQGQLYLSSETPTWDNWPIGELCVASTWVRVSHPGYQADVYVSRSTTQSRGPRVTLEPGVWTKISTAFVAIAQDTWWRMGSALFRIGGGNIESGVTFDQDGFSFPNGSDEYFDGDTPDDLEYTYEWTGAPHASTSVRKTRPVAYLTSGLGDLTPSRTFGLYRGLPTTRLAETAVGGLYRLE